MSTSVAEAPPTRAIGRLEQLAYERHERDLKEADKRGLWFDEEAADAALEFYSCLRHSKGKWSGDLFKPEPWQAFIIRSIFGWKYKDGRRRFRLAHVEVARKNGKSFIASATGDKLLIADGEYGAEVYAAATKMDQAAIVHDTSKSQLRAFMQDYPSYAGKIHLHKVTISVPGTESKYVRLSSDKSPRMDGLNVSGAIIDEYHEHTSSHVFDSIDSATGARENPLILVITTAGDGSQPEAPCRKMHDMAVKVLEGTIQDDTFFTFIATIDEDDDWRDESCWGKANPNLGVSVSLEDLRAKFNKAKNEPSFENTFKRKHLNMWTEQDTRWIQVDAWEKCAGLDVEELEGQVCYGGLDLGSTLDTTSFSLVFPNQPEPGHYGVLQWTFIPEDNVTERERRDRVPFTRWRDLGYVFLTPGNVTDYSFVREKIKQFGERYKIQAIAYDPYNAMETVTALQEQEGFTMAKMRQGFLSMSSPAKAFERAVMGRFIHHDGNPVLRWMVSNASVVRDAADNIKPDKSGAERNRIDGVVSTIMGLGLASEHTKKKSVYSERGPMVW